MPDVSSIPNQTDPLDAAAGSTAAAQDPHHAHRVQRSRRLKLSIASSLLIKPLAFFIPIITIPLLIKYLGSEQRYGLYETVGAVAMWVSMVNVGMNLGLINKLTECDVAGDRERARLYVSTLSWAMLALLVVVVAAWTVVNVSVDWARAFKLTEPAARAEASWSVWVAVALTLLGLVATIPAAVYAGYQEIHRFNLWDGAMKLSLLAGVIVLVFTPGLAGLGVVGVLLAVSGTAALVRIVNIVTLFGFEKPWLRPSPRLFDFATLKVMLLHGVNLFVLQMAVLALFQTDKLIIGARIGAEEVAGYSILARLFLSGYGVFALILSPLWPAYGEAVRRGDLPWVRRQVARTRVYGAGAMLLCGVGMLVAGDWVIRVLSPGTTITVSKNLVVAVAAMFMVRAWVESQSIVLNAANVFVPQMLFFGSHAALNIGLAIVLAKPFGVEGVAWSATITGLLTSVWGYPWMIRKYILNAPPPPAPPPAEPRPGGFEPVIATKRS